MKGRYNRPQGRSGISSRFSSAVVGRRSLAAYVIREHNRGRHLNEILEDRYVKNRLGPQQLARLLDRPEVMNAIGDDPIADPLRVDREAARLELCSDIALARALDRRRADREVPRGDPFDLKTTRSSSD